MDRGAELRFQEQSQSLAGEQWRPAAIMHELHLPPLGPVALVVSELHHSATHTAGRTSTAPWLANRLGTPGYGVLGEKQICGAEYSQSPAETLKVLPARFQLWKLLLSQREPSRG